MENHSQKKLAESNPGSRVLREMHSTALSGLTNAAWWRLNCLGYNVISVLKRKALPESFWPVRMKALRFHLIGVAGKVVSHALMTFLKITGGLIGYRKARNQWMEFSSA